MSEFAPKPAESSHAVHTVSGPSAGPAIELAREKHYSIIEIAELWAATDEGAIRSENAIDPLWAAATFVVDVVGRAGRIVAGVNGLHGISLGAEPIVRLLYDSYIIL
jgi:hypothetical protein